MDASEPGASRAFFAGFARRSPTLERRTRDARPAIEAAFETPVHCCDLSKNSTARQQIRGPTLHIKVKDS
jgi:hypothetical protein